MFCRLLQAVELPGDLADVELLVGGQRLHDRNGPLKSGLNDDRLRRKESATGGAVGGDLGESAAEIHQGCAGASLNQISLA